VNFRVLKFTIGELQKPFRKLKFTIGEVQFPKWFLKFANGELQDLLLSGRNIPHASEVASMWTSTLGIP